MKNIHIDEGTKCDIDRRITRILDELGNPQGKVKLADARDLLRLDLQYYASDDPGLLQEVVHRIKLSSKQVLQKPMQLIEAIKSFDLKALFFPDSKRILIDSSLHDLKKRWSEGHEITHSVIPWHADYMLGDNRQTLSPGCHERIEAEANYGAGQLLFPAKAFMSLAYSKEASMSHIRSVATHFGNSITSTLWRYVENSENFTFAVISEHPHHRRVGKPDVSYLIGSRKFYEQFSELTENEAFTLVKSYCGYGNRGPLGMSSVEIKDNANLRHEFKMESFKNSYDVLTLGTYIKPLELIVPMA